MARLALLFVGLLACESGKPAPRPPPAAARHDASVDAIRAEELAKQKAALPDHTPLSAICEKDPNAQGCAELAQRQRDAEAARKKLEALQEEAAKRSTHGPGPTPTLEECEKNPLAKGCDERRDATK